MLNESQLQKQVLVSCSGDGVRLWHNPSGSAYRGKVTRHGTGVIISHASLIKFGLCTGSSDLIGFKTIEITPDLVGQKIAVFAAIELKREKGGVVSQEQKNFIEMILEHGGIAGIAKSIEEVKSLLKREGASKTN